MNKNSEEENLNKLEQETRASAIKQLSVLLQRPDQLEKVEQYKKRYCRKKSAADALLKASIQSQLDGVKTGLNQLRSCLEDIKAVKTNLSNIHVIYESVSGLKDKLVDLSRESTQHHKYGSALESLKHVSNVPKLVEEIKKSISEDALLDAHRNLADLEASRDQLLLELYKKGSKTDDIDLKNKNEHDTQLLQGYFQEVQRLSEQLGKKLALNLKRTLTVVRQNPKTLVTTLRIIERECRADDDWTKRKEFTGFCPADRPKKWRDMAMDTLATSVEEKLEGCQLEDRGQHKMWLVRHLELIRRNTIEDLRIVKTLCEPCFPSCYDIVRTYVKLYHTSISQHLLNVIQNGLEGNEIISLLNWITMYYSEEFMGHRGLEIEEGDLGPLLAPENIEDLQANYLHTLHTNISEWMTNSLSTDKKEWMSKSEPETDGRGFYVTQLPVILFQIVEQNMQVAQLIGNDVVSKVLDLVLSEISSFANSYSGELRKFKEDHLKDRSQLEYYIQYIMANINNCDTLSELTGQLKNKYTSSTSDDRLYGTKESDRYYSITNQFVQVAKEGCLYLKEEIFLDIGRHLHNVLTRPWLETANDVDTICLTIEDYNTDLLHLRLRHYNTLISTIYEQILVTYLRQLFSTSRKITFRNADERREAAERITSESDQMATFFARLAPDIEMPGEFRDILPALAEILKTGDNEMLALELGTLLGKFPDAKADQLVNLLVLRENTGRSEANQLVESALAHQSSTAGRKSILSRV